MSENHEITGVLAYLDQNTKKLLELICELDGADKSEAIARAIATHAHLIAREKRGYKTLFVNRENPDDVYELVFKENVSPRNTNPNQNSSES